MSQLKAFDMLIFLPLFLGLFVAYILLVKRAIKQAPYQDESDELEPSQEAPSQEIEPLDSYESRLASFEDYIDFEGLFDWLVQEIGVEPVDEAAVKVKDFYLRKAPKKLQKDKCFIESANIIFAFESNGSIIEIAYDRHENRFVDYLEQTLYTM